MPYQTGPRNLITDVPGLRVGNVHDERLKSGVTVVIPERPAVASFQVLGGAPGTRETDALEPHNALQEIHAVVLSGGSAYGLDAASGVQAALREADVGLSVHGYRVPIVPAAILFDLYNGGDKGWGRYPPYRDMGFEAAGAASADFGLGSVGAGSGALSSGLKGGLGSASTLLTSGITVGALVAANPVGSVTIGDSAHFWAAAFEIGDEFGGLGWPQQMPPEATDVLLKFRRPAVPGANTTIGVIATDAKLSKAAAKRLAMAAHDGFVRAIWPTHTPADGDLVFALATGASGVELDPAAAIELFAVAGSTMARAVARGVHAAVARDGDLYPPWTSRPR